MTMRKLLPCLALLVLSGCATTPTGPNVLVLPGSGKPFDVFQGDDMACRQWASYQIGTSKQSSTATGAVAGTVVGGAAGAAIGAAAGDAAAGAAIGAGSGLLVGTASGANADQYYGGEAQMRYDHAYVQCMYAKGNQIPGVVRRAQPRQTTPPHRLTTKNRHLRGLRSRCGGVTGRIPTL